MPATNVYSTGSQTAYSMPLFFGMADDTVKKDVVSDLVKSIVENNKALTCRRYRIPLPSEGP